MTLPKIAFYLVSPTGEITDLKPSQRYVCGRDQSADVVVQDSLISRQHAQLLWDDGSFWSIKDLGSRNGTIVNEAKIEGTQQLLDRAQIRFGGQVYTYFMVPPGVDLDHLRGEAQNLNVGDTIEMESTAGFAPPSGFQGDVTTAGVSDLIQFFVLTRRNGRLDLSGEVMKSIWFVDGSPKDARFGESYGSDALTAAAVAPTERFTFVEYDPPPGDPTISATPEQILMNLALAMDNAGIDQPGSSPQPEAAAAKPTSTPSPEFEDFERPIEPEPATDPTPVGNPAVGNNINLVGKKFGSVALRNMLGHGAMAQVYRGFHEMFETDVAVKVMTNRGGGKKDEHNRKRFMREARIASKIKHPNVVQVMDAGMSDEGHAFLVMELVDGSSLGHVLEERGQLTVHEVCQHAPAIAEGLAAIHQHDVVHRDIKPDNILISSDGTPKISDLGMARQEDDEEIQRLTGTGVVLGTPLYIAPENAMDSHRSGPASDIYSFGASLYHLLAGRPPVTGASAFELMRAHLHGEWTPINQVVPDLDRGLVKLIHSCLAKEPEKRPDATTLGEALKGYRKVESTAFDARSGVVVSKDFKKMKAKAAAGGPNKAIVFGVLGVVGLLIAALVVAAKMKGII